MTTKDTKYLSILDELIKKQKGDYSFQSGKILGSMCTQAHPIAKKAYTMFLETNLGDPDLFPGTKEIEEKVIAFQKDLMHAPSSSDGLVVSGGTEGNITAIWLATQLTGKNEIMIPESAHFSFQKIASMMKVKLTPISLTQDFVINLKELEKKISPDTAAVVGIAGSTELGTIDPIPQLAQLCEKRDVFLHVDAAFGGFIIPFLKEMGYDVPSFDFSLSGVSSISLDAHKMGYAAIPMGTLLVREGKWLDRITVKSLCTSTYHQTGLLGTRSGGPVAASYAVFKYLGKTGYQKVVRQCMDVTMYTVEQIKEIGLPLIQDPVMNVIAIRLEHLDDIVNGLAEEGWKVNKIERLSALRLVLMPQIKKKTIDEFIPVLKKICQQVGEL